MDYSEKWGKDIDEAVRLALEDLGLTEDQVMVKVLEEPAKGFLGLGSKLAKVRVEKIADLEPDKGRGKSAGQDKKIPGVTRDLRKKNKPDASGAGRGGSGDRDRDRSGGRGRSGGDRDRDRSGGRGRSGGDRGRSGGDRGRSGGDRNRSGGHGRAADRNRSGGKRDGGKRDYEEYDVDIKLDLSDKPQFSEKPEGLVAVESNETSEFLKSILDNMDLDVNIVVSESDECVYIEVDGPDAKIVIGKRGQTLDAIQYLTNLVLNKDKEDYRRAIIDVEGYRTRREKTLEQLAAKLARKTIHLGQSVRLEPMNPYERKVIHATLQKVEGITTRSEGEEPYRRVIIEKE